MHKAFCDDEIIELYFRRDESAISATDAEYGALLTDIARNLLGTFHAPGGDTTASFMHAFGNYSSYSGGRFTAVRLGFKLGGAMWLLLPDEGVNLDELISDEDAVRFLAMSEKEKAGRIADKAFSELVVPRFDITSTVSLDDALRAFGITHDIAFGPAKDNMLSGKHSARVRIDEAGCEGAAYTSFTYYGGSGFPDAAFTLDRPFLFAVTAENGLPLFVGTVSDPS